ncbi:hypothetical protein QTH91_15785 [Variovorax dokdonensis]|uniref:Uncharacterized protein n=1 Tax=Variovorax dokdonensis TaxID=344883 RepID=A0ABT7NDC1_9BURK|nr:hypothetical protein [Variovorax dokdonensis]MDM0045949.1 hypothetical protein [Variovorax dokdonensis]
MSHNFWQVRLPMQLEPLSRMAQAFDPALRDAITGGVSPLATIEAISAQPDPGASPEARRRIALLISVEGVGQHAGALTCWMAFSNDEPWCDDFRRHGIPIVESRIDLERGPDGAIRLVVHSPAYPLRSMSMPITLRDQRILTLEGVRFALDGDDLHYSDGWAPGYRQFKSAPDIARQTTDLSISRFSWSPLRRGLRTLDGAGVALHVDQAAWPALADVFCQEAGAPVTEGFEQLSAGRFLDPTSVFAPSPAFSTLPFPELPFSCWPRAPDKPVPPKVERLPAASVFGAPHFVFDNVEVVGFRLSLPDSAMPMLQKLAGPLNFHRDAPGAMDDFSWRVATPTVVIELLHYGQMRTRSPAAPLMPHDYMSQHEVLVRLLVGKVDDDGSQARDASLFVPTIFVDNPWSKMVGRESQGFPKELAQFCIREDDQLHPLDMAGRRDDREHSVSQVVLVRSQPGFRDAQGHRLLELRYPTHSGDDQRFERVDLDAVLGNMPGFSRWRQSDFGGREFRKSFARQAMSNGFSGFRTVQATPVDKRGLPPTWIHGQMKITSMTALFPPGIASLSLSAKGRPEGDPWRALCEVLGQDDINLPAGDWYRLRMNLDLSVSDSLSW